MKRCLDELREYIFNLEIVDTHEHLPAREDLREKPTDVLREYLTHYLSSDLVSAGLSPENLQRARDIKIPLPDRWQIVAPYWEACRHTGYCRSLDIAVRDLYNIEEIRRDTIEELDAAFQKSLEAGQFNKVLKEKSKIRISLLDSNPDCDRDFFRTVFRLDAYILPRTGEEIRTIEKEHGTRIASLEDWLEACEACMDRWIAKGAVALKSALAYLRTLKFEKVTRYEAERDFNAIFERRHFPDWEPDVFSIGKDFQDYMMHYILGLAGRRRLPVQIHTGIHAGNGNYIYHSDPSLLSNLFIAYPDVRFDLFHIGYPYHNVLGALAKTFPNVFIDMCWAHIISPNAATEALCEWIDTAPINKISAFGGDYCFIDGVYGHQYLARENVCRALSEKVEQGIFGVDRAKQIARMLFYDNPLNLFGLKEI